jgi:hypothetical protein
MQLGTERYTGELTDSVQKGSGAQPAPIQWVPADLFPGVKRQGREADPSPRSSAEVKNNGATPLMPNTSSRRGA